MINQIEETRIGIDSTQKIVYRKMMKWIFSWWVEIHRIDIGKDLHIETKEVYDKIYINGQEFTPLTNK